MVKIVFFSIAGGKIFDEVIHGIKTRLSSHIKEPFEINHCKGSPDQYLMRIHIKSALKRGVNVIVTSGALATHIALEETQKSNHLIPIVFWGITDPVDLKVIFSIETSKNNATGVFMEAHQHFLPFQILARSNPKLKDFLFLYRANGQHGRTATEVMSAEKYFFEQNIRIARYPVVTHIIDKKTLIRKVEKVDAMVSIEASLCYPEFALIAEHISKPGNKPSWSHGKEASEVGALFSVDNDYTKIGFTVAEQIEKIIVNELPPGRIKTKCLRNSRNLLIDERAAINQDIFLTKKLIKKFKECFSHHEQMETIVSFFVTTDAHSFGRDLFSAFSYNMRLENDAHLHYEHGDGWLTTHQFEQESQLYNIASLTHTKAVIAFGEKQAKLIHDHFKQHQVKKPIICIANAQETVTSSDWHAHGKSYGVPVVRAEIPPPNIHDMYNMLIAAAPDLEYIIFISGVIKKELLPQHLHNQIEQLKFLSHKHGKRFRVIHAPSAEYLEIFPLSFLQPGFGFIVCGESIPYSVMRTLGERFSGNNVPAVAGSLTWARWFPLNIGIDADAMAEEKLMPVLKRLLIEKRSPHEHTVKMNYHEWYYAIINESLSQQLNLDIPAAKMATRNYKTGTIDHAQDIAICMGQFTVEERLAMLDEEEKTSNKVLLRADGHLRKKTGSHQV